MTLVLLVYGALSAWCVGTFMQKWGFLENRNWTNFTKMLDHTAHRPWAYRVLVPWIINHTWDLVPLTGSPWFNRLEYVKLRGRFFRGEGKIDWTPEYARKFQVAYGIVFVSILGTALILRQLTISVFPGLSVLADVGPAVFLTFLPMSFILGGYMYDFPELFFLALSFWLANTRRYIALGICVPLAILNKETSVLLPVLLFPLFLRDLRWRRALGFVGLLLVVGVPVFLGVRSHFASNPGGLMYQMWENVEFFTQPSSYFLMDYFYAPLIPFPQGFNLLWMAFILALVWLGWRDSQAAYRQLLVLATIVNFPLLFLFGTRDEMRNLSLMFIPLYLMCCHGVRKLYEEPGRRVSA